MVKSNPAANSNKLKALRTFILTALSLVLFYPPYLQGLFFEKDLLPTEIYVFALFIIFLVYKGLRKERVSINTPIEYTSIGFIVVYLVSLLVAVHTRSAIAEVIKYCMYFAVFYMVSDLADSLNQKILILLTLIVSAVGVSIIGLDSAMGGKLVSFLNKLFGSFGVEGNLFFGLFVDNRINSTLQYPNALAAYVIAVFFVVITLLLLYKKWWQRAIYGSLAYILMITFLLTRSRGALVVAFLSVLFYVFVNPKGSRLISFIFIILISIPSFGVALLISPLLSVNEFSIIAFIMLFVGILLSGFLAVIAETIENLVKRINAKVCLIIFSGIVAIGMATFIYMMNQSVPVELSNYTSEEIVYREIAKDIALNDGKEYILSYDVQAKREQDQPYAYVLQIYAKNKSDILFNNSKIIHTESFMETDQVEQKQISFFMPQGTEIVSIVFINQYPGTGVILETAKIIDAESGRLVKKIMFKNKYNLDDFFFRFQNYSQQASLISRMVFYKDGFKIYKDRWLLGGGGGAWSYLYRQYQSYNYQSSQAHNYPLQLAIETGIIGVLLLIFFVLIVVFTYIRYQRKVNSFCDKEIHENQEIGIIKLINPAVITASATLLMHSLIDFDFSEAAIFLLFWEMLAIYNRNIRDILNDNELMYFRSAKKLKKKQENIINRFAVIFIILVAILALYFTSSFTLAAHSARQAFSALQKNDLEGSIENMERAVELDKYNEEYVIGYKPIPNRPDLMFGLADLLILKNDELVSKEQTNQSISQKELVKYQNQISNLNSRLLNIEKTAENNLFLNINLAGYYLKTGKPEKGMSYLDKAISMFPFEPTLWNAKVNVYYQYIVRYYNDKDYENVQKYISLAMDVIGEATATNKTNLNPFLFPKETVSIYEKIRILQNGIEEDIQDINQVVHISLFDLDINQDNLPDQWYVYNPDKLSAFAEEGRLYISASGRGCISARYPLSFSNRKTYKAVVKMEKPIDFLGIHVVGVTADVISMEYENGVYTAEIYVKDEADIINNELRIFVEEDCVIESILIIEI